MLMRITNLLICENELPYFKTYKAIHTLLLQFLKFSSDSINSPTKTFNTPRKCRICSQKLYNTPGYHCITYCIQNLISTPALRK